MAEEKKTNAAEQEDDRIFIKYAAAVFAVSFLLVCVIYHFGGHFLSGSLRTVAAVGDTEENALAYVLLMGVDRREGDAGRSDTLMLAAIDEEHGRASLLSIPRDTRVKVGDYGYDKINHAYAYGGHTLTLSAVSSLVGVPISHYVIIDTSAFERIVDAVGGVDIDVEKRMYYEDPWDDNGGLVIDLRPGLQHMDGAHAIQYVRYRDGEGDIGRIGRQQHFMRALFAQLISPQVLPRLSAVMEEIKGAVETDLSVRQLITLAKQFKEVESHGMDMQMVPGSPAYLGDVSYWIPDIAAARRSLYAGAGKTMSDAMEAAAVHDAAAYRADMPERLRVMAETDTRAQLPPSEELLAEGDRSIGAQRASHNSAEEKTEEQRGTQRPPEKKTAGQEHADNISVMVINASGIDGAGAEVADILRTKGFRIGGVETGRASDRPKTAVMTADAHVNLFYGMPFPCVIMPVDGAGDRQAIVIIGRDYKKDRTHRDRTE
ncbi:LCP family protein [uncultured Selenomonas sp.]|uniref:LCP family protein n=1 Tax=uncultured Selenomonas sp. TaxID=159275 RepID=UPI0028D1B272|nr:LCP family protein [uncultured Selenomonas sp.]